MRSWPSVLLLLVCACGNDVMSGAGDDQPPPTDADTCQTSYLRYENFGEPFALDWCRGCHSAAVPKDMRQKAPMDVNFDSYADVAHWRERIMVLAAGTAPTMPPAGGPSDDERKLLGEWLGCGAPQ